MSSLDDKYVKISAKRFLRLLELEDLALTLYDLGVEDWEMFHQEAYYRKTYKELEEIINSFILK